MLRNLLCHSELRGRRTCRRLFAPLRVTPSNKYKHQKGFTLIEMIIVVALIGMISAAATMAIHQVLTGTTLSNDLNTAINQIHNAGYWINQDVQMAKPGSDTIVDSSQLDDPDFLQLTIWKDATGDTTHTVMYTLQDGKLLRDGQLIAEYIQPKQEGVTWCDWDETTLLLTATITAQIGEEIEARTFEVKPRPDPVS
ncbi:MAG: prepilin-type N-terminal cleavage/methylation domain-containing protein [Dehalococcoidia bacterium]|nr:prepilin-type N-terminal cleavage/methylation domain-containing protein [Dehalococcoidia bacterium]